MPQSVSWKQTDSGAVFSCGDLPVGTAVAAPGCRDHFVPMGDGVIRWGPVQRRPDRPYLDAL